MNSELHFNKASTQQKFMEGVDLFPKLIIHLLQYIVIHLTNLQD